MLHIFFHATGQTFGFKRIKSVFLLRKCILYGAVAGFGFFLYPLGLLVFFGCFCIRAFRRQIPRNRAHVFSVAALPRSFSFNLFC